MSDARLKSFAERIERSAPGHIYAAYSHDGEWIKIGFSSRILERLVAINRYFSFYAPFQVIGFVPSTYRAEMQIHRVLRRFRYTNKGNSREIYPAIPFVVDFVSDIFRCDAWSHLDLREAVDVMCWCSETAKLVENRYAAMAAYWRLEYGERSAA